MKDIKVKKKTNIKVLDKTITGTKNIKDNLVSVKEKSKDDNSNVISANDYATNKITSAERIAENKLTNNFNKVGINSVKRTKENIVLTKNKIAEIKNNNISKKMKDIKVKGTKNHLIKNTTNTSIKGIKTPQKVEKYTKKVANESIKLTKRIAQTSKKLATESVKVVKATAKASVKVVKSIAVGTKALVSLIVAGGWISVIIILIMCLFGGIFALFNSNGDKDTAEMWKGNIVSVAESQVGVTGGDPYWSWYGFNERVSWCACFVSWCADQCNYIENGTIPKFSACTNGMNWFKEKNQWQDRSNDFAPLPGFIIFFDWADEKDGVPDHVGIVEKSNNKKVYTIEGNAKGDICKKNTYDINSDQILGYGIPKY